MKKKKVEVEVKVELEVEVEMELEVEVEVELKVEVDVEVLLAFYSKYGAILYRLRGIATYCSKITNLPGCFQKVAP